MAEARGQGPGLAIACPRSSRSARSERPEVAPGEVEGELSKFRELWQGPAERLEEFPELAVASMSACMVRAWASGLPEAEPVAVENELELLRFLELSECVVLRAAAAPGRGRGRCPKSSVSTRKRAIVPSKGDYKVVSGGW